MTPLFKKLNFKNQPNVVILRAPESFGAEMNDMQPFTQVFAAFNPGVKTDFALAFAMTQAEVDAFAVELAEKTSVDAVIWIAYPKGSSKKYKCDFNRDTGWGIMGQMGFEPVRMVALDEDWSALRFRRVDFIKTMTRSFAMTEAGKAKVEKTKSPPAPLTIPTDLARAFEQSPAALHFFDRLAPSHKKEYIRWIEEAKRPETRTNRIVKAVEMLREGKKLS